MTPARLDVEHVTCHVAGRDLVADVSLTVEPGQFVGLIGPNGAGKSTLLRTVYRARRPTSGTIRLDGDDLWSLPIRHLARRTAAVLQENVAEFELTVEEVVAMGRSPHKRALATDTDDDHRIIDDALALVDASALIDQPFAPLSGGEKQRVLIARALVQQPALLVLDEPTNHLDIAHQLDVLERLRGTGISILAALHDLNLAALYCDRIYALHDGRLVRAGAPAEVLTADLLAEIYGVRAEVSIHPATGRPLVVVLPRIHVAHRVTRSSANWPQL